MADTAGITRDTAGTITAAVTGDTEVATVEVMAAAPVTVLATEDIPAEAIADTAEAIADTAEAIADTAEAIADTEAVTDTVIKTHVQRHFDADIFNDIL